MIQVWLIVAKDLCLVQFGWVIYWLYKPLFRIYRMPLIKFQMDHIQLGMLMKISIKRTSWISYFTYWFASSKDKTAAKTTPPRLIQALTDRRQNKLISRILSNDGYRFGKQKQNQLLWNRKYSKQLKEIQYVHDLIMATSDRGFSLGFGWVFS